MSQLSVQSISLPRACRTAKDHLAADLQPIWHSIEEKIWAVGILDRADFDSCREQQVQVPALELLKGQMAP